MLKRLNLVELGLCESLQNSLHNSGCLRRRALLFSSGVMIAVCSVLAHTRIYFPPGESLGLSHTGVTVNVVVAGIRQ